MSFLKKKIYGFSVLEIGIFSIIFLNFNTILTFLRLGTKPIENAVDNLKDKQIQNTLGLTNSLAQFMKQASDEIYSILNPPKSFFIEDIDEKALVDFILSKFTTSSYWNTFKRYYKEDYGQDLVQKIKSCVTQYYDWTQYNRIKNAVTSGQSHFRELL